MHKEEYEQNELEIILFHSLDIITESIEVYEEDEGQMMPGH